MVKDGTKPAKAVKVDPNLSADVRQFASSLGLVSGGGGDNAFDDFAPQKAKMPIKKAPAARKDKQKAEKGGGKKRGDDAPAPVGDAAKDRAGGGKKDGDGKTKSREWNFGVGPRPGIMIIAC